MYQPTITFKGSSLQDLWIETQHSPANGKRCPWAESTNTQEFFDTVNWRQDLISVGRWANLLVWSLYLLWAWFRTKNAVLLVLAVLIVITDFVLIVTKNRNEKQLQVIRAISVFVVAPLMIYYGIKGRDTVMVILGVLLLLADGGLLVTSSEEG